MILAYLAAGDDCDLCNINPMKKGKKKKKGKKDPLYTPLLSLGRGIVDTGQV